MIPLFFCLVLESKVDGYVRSCSFILNSPYGVAMLPSEQQPRMMDIN